MQKQIKILLTLLMALFLAVSCAKNNPNNPTKTKEEMLQQKWQCNDTTYGISQYIITDSKFDSLYEGSVSYSVSISKIAWNSDNKSGIIYGQYTEHSKKELIGKWYAIAFKDLTETTAHICGASKDLGNGTFDYSAESLEDAKTKFTIDNGYFSFYDGTACTVVK